VSPFNALDRTLPTLLLSITTCIKEDFKASATELLYGTPLRIFTSSGENLTLNWQLPGWRPFHTNHLVFFSKTDFQLTTLCQLIIGSESESEWKSELVYDWRFTASQFFLKPTPLKPTTSFLPTDHLKHSPYGTSSLTKGWDRLLQLLLALASSVFLGFESRGTHDHILLSQIRYSPNLEGQVPVFISPRNRVDKLYPQALGSLFVASYDSQGYGGGLLPRLHTEAHWVDPIVLLITTLHGQSRKHRFQQHLSCCVRILSSGNVFSDPLTINGLHITVIYPPIA
jgi:hypothetical protein